MKNYIIINGKTATIIKKDSLAEAVTYCENYCDHSSEVIVREIKTLDTYNTRIINLLNK